MPPIENALLQRGDRVRIQQVQSVSLRERRNARTGEVGKQGRVQHVGEQRPRQHQPEPFVRREPPLRQQQATPEKVEDEERYSDYSQRSILGLKAAASQGTLASLKKNGGSGLDYSDWLKAKDAEKQFLPGKSTDPWLPDCEGPQGNY